MEARTRRDLGVAVSLANLLMLPAWAHLFTVGTRQQYWLKLSTIDFVAAAANVLLLAALLFGVASLVRRSGSRLLASLAKVVFLLSLLIPLNFVRQSFPSLQAPEVLIFLRSPAGMLVGGVVGLALITVGWRARGPLVRVARVLVLVLVPFAAVTVGRAVLTVASHDPGRRLADAPLGSRSFAPALPPVGGRVVVVVFDEFDQRLAFADRPAGLRMPEFDRLRGESLVASRAYSASDQTQLSIPAMLTGSLIHRAEPFGPSDLRLYGAADSTGTLWSEADGLFSTARSLGARTGVVGWNHPYCRIFAGGLQRCAWQPTQARPRDPAQSLASVMIGQLLAVTPWGPRVDLITTYRSMMEEAMAAVRDPSLDLVFVHLPIPHAPYIYDRRSGKFSMHRYSHAGYLDNLVLADRALGDLRRAMEDAGLWDRTSVLITSDHFWRLAGRYDGKRDYRVPFILKLTADTSHVAYDRPFNVVVTKDLAVAALRGRVRDAQAAADWLDGARTAQDTLGIYPMYPATHH